MPVMILFLYINFVLIKQAWFLFIKRKIFLTDAQLCLFVALYITLWPFVPTGNFFHNWLNVIYFLPIGVSIPTSKAVFGSPGSTNILTK